MASIPYSSKKHYLTGIDWAIQVLHRMTRRASGCGNQFQVVFELEGLVHTSVLKEQLSAFLTRCPYLGGAPSRDFNPAPFWKIASSAPNIPLHLRTVQVVDEQEAHRALESDVNLPFQKTREYFKVLHVACAGRSFLGFTFDHRLFDGQGAELFLEKFQSSFEGCAAGIPVALEPAYLDPWAEKFDAGKKINRHFIKLTENLPIGTSPKISGKAFANRFLAFSFDRDQTSSIIERATAQAGYLMFLPYALAVTVRAMSRVLSSGKSGASDWVIPVSIDMRASEAGPAKIFFNQLSFFFFRIRAGEFEDLPKLIISIKAQLYEQMKHKTPWLLQQASMLMRILPLPLFERMLQSFLRKLPPSFSFSSMGETVFKADRFMDKKILNIRHLPRIPNPPGVGVFFTQFQGKLNVVLSYLEGMLSDEEANLIVTELRRM
ncbi:MAG: hypothetical protein V1882_05730 [Candidatus Omnitrophota bacterium]